MKVAVQSNSGRVVVTLNDGATLGELRDAVKCAIGVESYRQILKAGD